MLPLAPLENDSGGGHPELSQCSATILNDSHGNSGRLLGSSTVYELAVHNLALINPMFGLLILDQARSKPVAAESDDFVEYMLGQFG